MHQALAREIGFLPSFPHSWRLFFHRDVYMEIKIISPFFRPLYSGKEEKKTASPFSPSSSPVTPNRVTKDHMLRMPLCQSPPER